MTRPLRFAINRICAMSMPLPAFVAMAQRLGAEAIELRNDLPGIELRDGAAARDVAALAAAHGLRIRSINALQRFDRFDAERAAQAHELVEYAATCGAEALVLCPTNDVDDPRDAPRRRHDLVHALRELQPLLAGAGLVGLVESLGFAECALRRKSQAVDALAELGEGAATFRLVHDTFHHHLASEDRLFAGATGLVHVSGVEDASLAVEMMRDPDRVLVGPGDRLGNAAQLRALQRDGYDGLVSFEPFAHAVCTAADIEQRLAASMAYLSAAVASSTGVEVSSVR